MQTKVDLENEELNQYYFSTEVLDTLEKNHEKLDKEKGFKRNFE